MRGKFKGICKAIGHFNANQIDVHGFQVSREAVSMTLDIL